MASRPSAALVDSGIRLHLPARATELVSFAYSPVFEAALSLHVVAGPKHHALQHGWVRRVRRLPVDLRKRVDAFRFAVFTDVPDFLLPSTDGGFLSFEEVSDLARHPRTVSRARPSTAARQFRAAATPAGDRRGDTTSRVAADRRSAAFHPRACTAPRHQ